jgi:hypothetical protein
MASSATRVAKRLLAACPTRGLVLGMGASVRAEKASALRMGVNVLARRLDPVPDLWAQQARNAALSSPTYQMGGAATRVVICAVRVRTVACGTRHGALLMRTMGGSSSRRGPRVSWLLAWS